VMNARSGSGAEQANPIKDIKNRRTN